MLNVLHDQLLALSKFERGERVSLPDDGNDVNARGETAHELDVQLAQTVACTSLHQ